MKIIIVALLLAVIGFFALNINKFISTTYSSPDIGISFDHGISWSVLQSSAEQIKLVRSGITDNSKDFIFIEKIASADNAPIDFRLTRDSGLSPYGESEETKGAHDGVSFSWKGDVGEEKGFAFGAADYIYVIGTEGYSRSPGAFSGEFDRVLTTFKAE